MPPDSPSNRQALPRSRVVEIIEHAEEDALAQLRKSGMPETQAVAVMLRIHSFCLQTLRELDHMYREYEELLDQDSSRSEEGQLWLTDKTTGLVMRLEVAVDSLVSSAIEKLKEEYKRQSFQQGEVITTVPFKPPPSAWQQLLHDLRQINPWLLLPIGLALWFLLWWAVSSLTWAVIAVGISAFVIWLFAKPGLWVIGVVGLFFLLILVF
jgi:hypothetical protein